MRANTNTPGRILALVFSALLVSALAAVPTPSVSAQTAFTLPGGSLTTTDLNAWGGFNTHTYAIRFDFSAGPTTITMYGMDLTDIWYEGKWPWPPLAESLGAQARFGITADGFWSLHSIHSAIGNGGGSWDQQGAAWDHDDGFRKYLIQNQWSGTTPGVTVGNHQYNVEAYIPRTGAGPSVNDPAQVTDRAYNTFDMKITYTPTGTPGEYQVQGWVRLHKAASTDEMAIRPGSPTWGSPYTWVWNRAINNQASPEDAWAPFYDGDWVITGDYTSARPYAQIMNWGVPQTRYHTFSWNSMVVEGTPAPVSEVCVDDDFAGSSNGDQLSGAGCGMGTVTFGYDAFASVQDGLNTVVSGGTVHVAAGTYAERLTINKSVDLRGAQYGVDPTPAGARTNPANESIITEAGLPTPNPDVLIEIPNGVTNVKLDGFTLEGDRFNTTADTSVVRCWDDDITIGHNIVDGMYGVLYKGADNLTVHRNRMVVNKLGVTVQPNPATNVTISDNVIALGSSPVGGESATYMTSCSGCSVIGNTGSGFVNGRGTGGSNLNHLTISGNTFTGNNDGVSIWGNSTFITISDNDLSNSLRYGINIKGQDVTITGNQIKNNGDTGISIARHVIDTERVEIHQNNITGNFNYGIQVDTANVSEIVNATCNWWNAVDGPSGSGPGSGDAVTDGAYFQPWLTQQAPSDCDYEGPITSNVLADPNPVAVNTDVTATANVDDTSTGSTNIASAEYSPDGGTTWVAMAAQDGSFDEVSEDVTAAFTAPSDAGIYTYNLCVRGTDMAGNIGADECIELMLVVYDPSAGFVTGGGWIDSPPDAYRLPISGDTSTMSYGGYSGYLTRYTDIVCDPNVEPVTFSGTVDVTDLQDNGAVFIGLVDKQCVDGGETGYMGGAYVYFGRRGNNIIVGPTDGNLGGEIVQTFATLTDYYNPDGTPPIDFSAIIHDGSVVVTLDGTDYVDDYGSVKTLNNQSAYPWDEFEHMAYVGVDSWPPANAVLYDVTIGGCGPTGKATFGFVAKYKKGAQTPEGNTEFVFKAADLNFHSTSYDWLVVNQGGTNAQFKGSGTINGESAPNGDSYRFMLWAGDGDLDTFRIRIWWEEANGTEHTVYDNGAHQPIAGGNIVVHTKK